MWSRVSGPGVRAFFRRHGFCPNRIPGAHRARDRETTHTEYAYIIQAPIS
jgi:hypothetical protein